MDLAEGRTLSFIKNGMIAFGNVLLALSVREHILNLLTKATFKNYASFAVYCLLLGRPRVQFPL